MRKWLVKILVTLFLIGMFTWLGLILSTQFLPAGNPVSNFITSALGLPSDFSSIPKPKSAASSFDDIIYTDAFYNMYAISTSVILIAVFTLARGRNFVEKVILLQAYALPREREYWGKITDAFTHKPVQFATVRILKVQDGKEIFIEQTVTDLDGRYRLYIANPSGVYLIEVLSSGYATLKERIQTTLIQGKFVVRMNLVLQPVDGITVANPVQAFLFKHRSQILFAVTLYVLGLSLLVTSTAIYSLVAYPGISSYGNMMFYGWPAFWNFFVLLERRKFNPGRILNTRTKEPIAGATIQILLPTGEARSILSDTNGIIKVDADDGIYPGKVFKEGYALKENVLGQLPIEITPEGFIKQDIYLTQFGHELPNGGTELLFQNPFAD